MMSFEDLLDFEGNIIMSSFILDTIVESILGIFKRSGKGIPGVDKKMLIYLE